MDGGSPITNYVVEKRDVRRKTWQTVDTTVKDLKYTVTPLNEGSLYVFRVAAENAVGMGEFCELEDAVLAKDTFSELLSKLSVAFKLQQKKFSFDINFEPLSQISVIFTSGHSCISPVPQLSNSTTITTYSTDTAPSCCDTRHTPATINV